MTDQIDLKLRAEYDQLADTMAAFINTSELKEGWQLPDDLSPAVRQMVLDDPQAFISKVRQVARQKIMHDRYRKAMIANPDLVADLQELIRRSDQLHTLAKVLFTNLTQNQTVPNTEDMTQLETVTSAIERLTLDIHQSREGAQ